MSGFPQPMHRRHFLAGAATGLTALGLTTASTARAAPLPSPPTTWTQALLDADPRLIAFVNGTEHDQAARIEGRLPRGLAGVLYRNGPGLFEHGSDRYRHWFDGDGLIQRWSIGPQGVSYRSRFAATPKFRTEHKAGQFVLPVSGGGIRPAAAFAGANSVNPSNTAVLPVNGALWALWEGGSPLQLDPASLAAGNHVDLGDGTGGAPFSAHPRVGADGRVWNVGSLGSRVLLYRLDQTGRLEAARVQPLGQPGYYHDFILTERSLVLVQCSTAPDGRQSLINGSFGSMRGVAGKPMKVHVFDRESFELVRQAELPPGFAFHFGNGWEEADGTIRFDIVHDPNGDEMLEFFKPMEGRFPTWGSATCLVILPPKGAPRFEPIMARTEFPVINPALRTRRNRYVYASALTGGNPEGWFTAVTKIDLDRNAHQVCEFGPDWLVEEHVFVPDPKGRREDHGWLVGSALNWRLGKTALTVIDARDLERGPVATAWLDLAQPLRLHAQFV